MNLSIEQVGKRYRGDFWGLRDFTGATPAGLASGMPLVFLGATALLMGAAVVGRRRQLAG